MLKALCILFSLTIHGTTAPIQADTSAPVSFQHEEARFLMGTLARIQISISNKDLASQCTAAGFGAVKELALPP